MPSNTITTYDRHQDRVIDNHVPSSEPGDTSGPIATAVRTVELSAGTIHYHDVGTGPPIVLLHGFLTNARLWRNVIPTLSAELRCIAPELPLGAHPTHLPHADLSAPGLARLVDEFLAALNLRNATLVGIDTGGAIAQLVATNHPDRIARLVLLPSDAYDNFPPRIFSYLKLAARVPGGLALLLKPLQLRRMRRLPIAFGWTTKRPIDHNTSDSYVRPAIDSRHIRADLRRLIRAITPEHTLAAAERFASFNKPVLIAWPREDKLFPYRHAEQLAKDFPQTRLEPIDDSYSFVPEDQPQQLSELIRTFIADTWSVGTVRSSV